MRLKEPFRGFNLVGGHTLFHLALLVTSLISLQFPAETKANEDFLYTVNMLRVAHALDVLFAVLKFLGASPKEYAKHCFTFKILDTVKMFFYLGAAMYALFHETQTKKALENPDRWIRRAEMWILIELLVFFGQVFCSVFFIFGVELRGALGVNTDPNFIRFKYDCLEFYQSDIGWFSYIFVMLGLHAFCLLKRIHMPSKSDNSIKLFFSSWMIFTRFIQLYLLMPYRRDDRSYTTIANATWIGLGVLELVGAVIVCFFSDLNGSITAGAAIVDVIVFLGQFVMYMVNTAHKQNNAGTDGSAVGGAKAQEPLLSRVAAASDVDGDRTKQSRQQKSQRSFEVADSIYNLAFVTLLDPVVVQEWQAEHKDSGYLGHIKLTDAEAVSVFQGVLIVIGIQIVTLVLITNEFVLSLTFAPTETFNILIPRLISCFYMHSVLAAEIKNGLDTMKYVVNHPGHFKRRSLDEDDHDDTVAEDGLYIRICYAFLLGLIQYVVAIILEIMSIIFLNSQTSYLFILICYASLAAVANFDNMYASALDEHPIRQAAGKKLAVTFNRYMCFQPGQQPEGQAPAMVSLNAHDKEDNSGPIQEGFHSQALAVLENPRQNCFLKFLRVIHKTLRVFHVSFFFYFAPFLMLFYQFYVVSQQKRKDA